MLIVGKGKNLGNKLKEEKHNYLCVFLSNGSIERVINWLGILKVRYIKKII